MKVSTWIITTFVNNEPSRMANDSLQGYHSLSFTLSVLFGVDVLLRLLYHQTDYHTDSVAENERDTWSEVKGS